MARVAHLAAAVALAAGVVVLGSLAGAQEQTASASSTTLTQARGEAARARERAGLLDAQARTALTASAKATFEAAALAARVQQAEAALAGAEANVVVLAQARRALDLDVSRESAPVTRLIAGLQSQVRHPPLLQVLQPGSLSDAVHLRAVVAAVEPQILARTAALRRETAQARALETEAARVAASMRTMRRDLVERRSQLATLAVAERLKASRASGAADREAERAFAIAAETRNPSTLAARLDRSGSAVARAGAGPLTPTAPGSSAPDRMPVIGVVMKDEGERRGLTVSTRPGALVVAPGAGRIAFAGPYRGYDSIVIIEHAQGWTSLITGLATTQLAPGQAVVAGSPLGQAGSQDPRITVELRRNGAPVDPAMQLR